MICKHAPRVLSRAFAFFQTKKDGNLGCPLGKAACSEPRGTSQRVVSASGWGDRWMGPGQPGVLARRLRGGVRGRPPLRSPAWPPDSPPPQGVPLCTWLGAACAEGPERGGRLRHTNGLALPAETNIYEHGLPLHLAAPSSRRRCFQVGNSNHGPRSG